MSIAIPALVQRGQNPEPEDGWAWSLSDYEIAYVREFNARPPRDGWIGSERDEARLDDEANGIRAGAANRPRRLVRRSLVLVVGGVLVVCGLVAGGLGIVNLLTGLNTQADTADLVVKR
ncbi:hypothetical protein [Rhodoglobus aureus]|uniref:Uncharacterized protein n=1 Tax=Rhodoglobus aureus TaxID=191497 RepID=A0ABN1VKB3_9MICO